MRAALLLAIFPALAQAAKYAVIAAGSKGYMNYRHQADACHAYHIMRNSGIPEENIILMMQDDVAGAHENPFPGKLFNKPGTDPVDVYAGCKIDYRGEIVTAKLFTSVITGNRSGVPANGKVLQSGADDKVFLNFVDHGGVGIVAFPNGPTLHVTELQAAIEQMQQQKMFKELVFYMEACESGSMFPHLTATGKVLAVTAANAKESSYGWYCGSEAKVKGKEMGTPCLGDLFSISWMEDSESGGNMASETIKEQIDRITLLTNKSHVLVFGDTSFEQEPIGNFQRNVRGEPAHQDSSGDNGIDVRDADVHQAFLTWSRAKTPAEKAEAWRVLMAIVAARTEDERVFRAITDQSCSDVNMYKCREHFETGKSELKDTGCHLKLVQAIFNECPRRELHHSPGGWNGYNMKFSQVLANLCEGKEILGKSDDRLRDIVKAECSASRSRSQSSELVV